MHEEIHGLTDREATKRLRKYGPNVLKTYRGGTLVVLARQFANPFVVLLLIAACITFALHEVVDTIMIFSFVVINGALGFVQEFRSEKALKKLSQLTVSMTHVIRGGKEKEITADQLVPGDLLVLREGDVLPADVRFIQAENVQVDESILTGESLPCPKNAGSGHHALGFSQTSLISGVARGIVTETGARSRIGAIDTLALSTRHKSKFDEELGQFGKSTLRMVSVALIFLAIVRMVLFPGEPVVDLLIFAVALAISVIPEALPLVTTFALSTGALHLAKRHVIVKRLSSIEDLGSIRVLCCDKTGTLTRNRLECANVYGNESDVFLAAALGCTSKTGGFDGAIWKRLSKSTQQLVAKAKRLHEEPFDAATRLSSVLVSLKGKKTFVMRGAPEVIANHCDLSKKEIGAFLSWVREEGIQGRRVLAFTQGTSEKTCATLGAISFVDPVKPGVKAVIKKAHTLGITVKILSGDSAEVTGAVATQAGIIDDPSQVILGDAINKLTPRALSKLVQAASVFARVSPEQKHRIIQALEEHSAVGFMGEGVNDAPALRAAHVGIVVRDASDIARASADVILVEPDLEVIIDGIREGRKIFANTVKYVRATVTSNFGNFFAIIAASFFIPFLPMTAVQILFVNLLSDFPMMTIVTDNTDKEDIAQPHTEGLNRVIGVAIILGLVSTVFDLAFFFMFVKSGASILQTNWFMGSILTELLLLFSIRTARPFFLGSRPSKTLTIVSLVAAAFTIILPFTPIATFLHFTAPTLTDLGLIALLVVGYVLTSEVVKFIYLRIARKRKNLTTLGWA